MGSGNSKDPASRKGGKGQQSMGIEGKKVDTSGGPTKNIPKANPAKPVSKPTKEVHKVVPHKQPAHKFEAKAEKKAAPIVEPSKKQDEQEELSLEQVAAQKYQAYEAQQQAKKMQEQEEMSIEQQAIQQYKAFAAAQAPNLDRQDSKQRALMEADALLDAFAPPPAAKAKNSEAIKFYPDSGSQADRDAISCVVPGELYLTNFRGVGRREELESLGVRHIVCVNEQENEFADKFNYFNIDNLEDQEDHDAMQHFASVAKFTDHALASGGAVCFHCAAGISRSSTMMISYLMTSKKMSLLEAFEQTYNARRVTWPNRTFMQQLIEYEHELQKKGVLSGKKPSLTLEEWDRWTACDAEQVKIFSAFIVYHPLLPVLTVSLSQFWASKEASLQDRTASIRGKESAQFLAFKENLQKELSKK